MTGKKSMQRARSRPNPVSCQSCRSKKLKCNRVQPCSNCAARGISCHFLVPPERQTGKGPVTPTHSIPEILDRLERLESAVFHNVPTHDRPGPARTPENNLHGSRSSPTPVSENINWYDVQQTQDRDSELLENVGTREDSLLPNLSCGIAFKVSSVHDILEAQTFSQNEVHMSNYPLMDKPVVLLPTYRVAYLLFQNFESRLYQMCPILHLATVRDLMKTLYLRLGQGLSVAPGQAALVLSLLSLSAFFYYPTVDSEVAATNHDAAKFSNVLSKGTLDALDQSRRDTSGTLEDVQAYILASFMTFHSDGFSARARFLSATAVSIARDLRLHQLDALDDHSIDENDATIRTVIDHEVKRRVFWHIAAQDWLHSTISGPQQGMYFIHLNHVNVNLPKDRFDDDIILGEVAEDTIWPRPNGTVFFLERIRLAHLCREIADIVPPETSKLLHLPYDHIIALDKKLEGFISNLPFFLKHDAKSRAQSKPLEIVYSHIPVMRYSITNAAHSRRCKLHQKFLLRQSSNPRYAYSRRVCLESARAVLQGYEAPSEDDSPSYVTARMGIAMHYTHLALVVMVMDLCFNKDEANESDIKAEVREALQKFEEAKHISPLPSRFLTSLRSMLQRHKVYLDESPTHTAIGLVNELQSTQFEQDVHYPEIPFDASFDEFWQFTSQSEANIDLTTWDNLFSALDSRPI
ncbi:hypothetical protein M426DRAFT_26226 [Hypoxylon sp. CI-4A]|nr:hypothetical protein M426DRAFT_26226 [Hypoxylon sp. CI-4A]